MKIVEMVEIVEMVVEVVWIVQYPYFEDEERKRVALISNRIANQMKTVYTIHYIKYLLTIPGNGGTSSLVVFYRRMNVVIYYI